MRVIDDKNQISEDGFDFMNSNLPFPKKSVSFDLAKLFSISIIIYFSAIKTLICYGEIEFDNYFLQFCTKYDTRFCKYSFEPKVTIVFNKCHKKGLNFVTSIHKTIFI